MSLDKDQQDLLIKKMEEIDQNTKGKKGQAAKKQPKKQDQDEEEE